MFIHALYLSLICLLVVLYNGEVFWKKSQELMEKTKELFDVLVYEVKEFFYLTISESQEFMNETKKMFDSVIVNLNHSASYENEVIKKLIFMIEDLLDKGILNEIKENIINEGLIHPLEYIVFEYEFKKHLILTQFMESPPIYNEQVKLILDKFSSYTDEYKVFLEKFSGKNLIYKNKEIKNLNMFSTDEMFVLLYSNLFRENGYEERLYSIFKNFRYSMHFLDVLNKEDSNSIKNNYFKFNKNHECSEIIDLIITDIIDLQKQNQNLLLFRDKRNCYFDDVDFCINGDEFDVSDVYLTENGVSFKGQEIIVNESCYYIDSDIYQYIHVRTNRKHSSYNELKFLLLLNSNLIYYDFNKNENIREKELQFGIDTTMINSQSEKEYKQFSLPSYEYQPNYL